MGHLSSVLSAGMNKPRPPRSNIDTSRGRRALSAAPMARDGSAAAAFARAVTFFGAGRRRPGTSLGLCWSCIRLWTCWRVRWRVSRARNGRVPCLAGPAAGAVTAVCQPATRAVIAARSSSHHNGVVIGTNSLPFRPCRGAGLGRRYGRRRLRSSRGWRHLTPGE